MAYQDFTTLTVATGNGVATATLEYGELNLMDMAMLLDIDHFVSSLAQRIAGFPAQALALAKASVTNTGSIEEELNFEERVFLEAVHSEPARRRMDAAMAMGMQTPIIEKCCFTHIWSPLAGV